MKGEEKTITTTLGALFGLRPLYPMSPTRQSNRITPLYKWKVKKKQLPPPLVRFLVSAHFIRCHRLDNQIELLPLYQWKEKKKQLPPPLVCFFVSAHFIRCHRLDNQIELLPLYQWKEKKKQLPPPLVRFLVSAHFIRCSINRRNFRCCFGPVSVTHTRRFEVSR